MHFLARSWPAILKVGKQKSRKSPNELQLISFGDFLYLCPILLAYEVVLPTRTRSLAACIPFWNYGHFTRHAIHTQYQAPGS